MGVISAAIAGNWDPVQIFVDLGLGVFGLLMLILAAWTTNVTNIYVASLALANMTGWLRVKTSTIASVVGILLAVAGIYSFQGLVDFLTLITALLIPTTGVLVVDYFVRNRQQMLADELFKEEDSAYWFTRVGTFAPWSPGRPVRSLRSRFLTPGSLPFRPWSFRAGCYYLPSMNTEGVASRNLTETGT